MLEHPKKPLTFLKAELLLKYLQQESDELDTLVMCKPNVKLITTDQSLYEALGSLEDKNNLDHKKLLKLLENVEVISYRRAFGIPRRVLSFDRVDELQKLAKGAINE